MLRFEAKIILFRNTPTNTLSYDYNIQISKSKIVSSIKLKIEIFLKNQFFFNITPSTGNVVHITMAWGASNLPLIMLPS